MWSQSRETLCPRCSRSCLLSRKSTPMTLQSCWFTNGRHGVRMCPEPRTPPTGALKGLRRGGLPRALMESTGRRVRLPTHPNPKAVNHELLEHGVLAPWNLACHDGSTVVDWLQLRTQH